MARNLINHLVTSDRVQQLKTANQKGQLQKKDVHLLKQLSDVMGAEATPFNETDVTNKEAVGTFINQVEKALQTV